MSSWTGAELDALLAPAPAPPTGKGSRRAGRPSGRAVTAVSGELPEPVRRLLVAEVPPRGVSSRLLSLVLLCVELGLPLERTHGAAAAHAPSVGKYGERLEERVDAILGKHPHDGQSCLDVGCDNAPSGGGHSREQVRQTVRAMRAAASQYPWPPRKRLTMLAVLNAHLDMAERLGLLEYDFDRRRMAVAAAVSRETVNKRMRELLADGWLLLVGDGDVSTHAFTYRLLGVPNGPHHPQPLTTYQPAASQLCGPTSEQADVWRNGAGLGKTRRETWITLESGARTVEALAKATGRTPTTVRKHLIRFNALGMAGPVTEDVWHGEWEPYSVDWTFLEQHLEVAGYGERQQERFKRESADHRRYVQGGGGAWKNRPVKKTRKP